MRCALAGLTVQCDGVLLEGLVMRQDLVHEALKGLSSIIVRQHIVMLEHFVGLGICNVPTLYRY